MNRIPTYAALVLTTLSMRGEHLEARYVEGSELHCSQRDVQEMQLDEVTLNGEVLPPELLEQMEFPDISTRDVRTVSCRDTIVAVTEGRPTRVRRVFDEVRKHSVEAGEESDEVGPLEGRSVVTEVDDDVAELEGDDEEVDESYLTDHALVRYADYVLPEEAVDVGDHWQLEEESLRRLTGIEGSPVYFESDVDAAPDAFREAWEQGSTISGEAAFSEIVERDGLRCALLAFEIEDATEIDDMSAFDEEGETGEGTGDMRFDLRYRGKLWYALDEGRPVAMEMDAEGTVETRMEVPFGEDAPPLQFKVKGTYTIDFESSWTTPE